MQDNVAIRDSQLSAQAGGRMPKGERAELIKIARHRERLAKNAVGLRAAELRAHFEQQIAAIYSFDSDTTWRAAHDLAAAATAEANRAVAERCRALGIPPEFAPSLSIGWYGRGENAVGQRRAELRRTAYARIDAMERDARLKIETKSVELQTRLIAGSLESDEAKAFLEAMPSAEMLMPMLNVAELPGGTGHPEKGI